MEILVPILLLVILLGAVVYHSFQPPEDVRLRLDPEGSYHLWLNNSVCGPYSAKEVIGMHAEGRVTGSTLITASASDDWLSFDQYQPVLQEPRPVVQTPAPAPEPAPSASRIQSGAGLTRAGGILLGIAVVLTLLLGMGTIEAILFAAGIILAVVGLCQQ